MKFGTNLEILAEIKDFEKFSTVDLERIDFNPAMVQKLVGDFDQKKIRVVFDMTHKQPELDGFTIHASSSNMKRAKFELSEASGKVFLKGAAMISVPLRISDCLESDYEISAIYADLWKGTDDAVKLIFDPIRITEFTFSD